MKTYDMAFSLGSNCGVSQALRGVGLQFASYPLDWVAVKDIGVGVRSITTDFDEWFEADDLELYTVCHSAGFLTRLYVNRRTTIGFSHEFNDFVPFAETYPVVRETYRRRIARFLDTLAASRRILAVWAELPTHARQPDPVYREALAALRAKCPDATVDLLVFCEDPACPTPQVVLDDGGLTVVAADYRKMDGKVIAHYVDLSQYARYLSANVQVPDTRTAEEKRAFAAYDQKSRTIRWGIGKSPFRRRVNQWAYKLFRHLEGILRKRGLVHPDYSFWFWEDIRREAEGGAK